MPDQSPRVLVVSAPPMDGQGGTGVTLANLFAQFQPRQIAQLHLDPGTADPSLCGSSLRIPDNGSPLEARARLIAGARSSSFSVSSASTIAAARAARSPRELAKAWATATLDLSPVRLPADVIGWATEARPDLIYSQLGSVRVMRIVNVLSTRLGVPVVPHFMDDWVNTLYADHELFGFARRTILKELDDVMRRTPFLLAISRVMAEEYSARFKRDARIFMNCVRDEDFAASVPTLGRDSAKVLTYVGGLHLDRWRSLTRLAQTLLTVDPTAELRIHAPGAHLRAHHDKVTHLPNVRWGPPLEGSEVPFALASADVLVHVESYEPSARRYTRLSVSTKLPQYLAAGRPVLALGPPELASMRYLIETRSGVVLQEGDAAGLAALLENGRLRYDLAKGGLAHAREQHARSSVSKNLRDALRDVGGTQIS